MRTARTFSRRFLRYLLLAAVWSTSAVCFGAPAVATSSSTLAEAEAAFEDLKFEKTRDLANRSLELGRASPDEMQRLLYLIGVSEAALDQPEAAQAAFSKLLSLNPDATMAQDLSPKLRSPFMEAKGRTIEQGELGARASFGTENRIVVELNDPIGMARRVELSVRGSKTGSFVKSFKQAAKRLEFSRIPGPYLEYTIVASDEHGNRLLQEGSESEPLVYDQTPSAPSVEGTPQLSVDTEQPYNTEAVYVIAGWTLVGLGAATAAVAVPFHVERQNKADQFDSAGCSGSDTASQPDQCGEIEDDRDNAQRVATSLYSAGGGLMIAGVAALLLAPDNPTSATATPGWRCAPGLLSLGCSGQF